jgi:hypothetical protein
MAISYYPNRVVQFPTHRNLLDDVDANHINSIQAELTSVMDSLGINPHIFNDLQVDYTSSVAIPSDEGGVSDDDTLYTPTLRYYDPKVKPYDHGSVGQRLDNVERGRQFHCFKLRASGIDVATKSVALDQRPRGVRFPKPSAANDPYDMHNGLGVTLRKSGFWMLSGSLVYTLQGTTAGANNGIYQAVIDYDGNFIEGMDRSQETGSNAHPSLNPLLFGFFTRGTRISLRTSQNSGRNQKIRLARLAGVLIRETID